MNKSIFRNAGHEAQFRQEGYLVLDVFNPDELNAMRATFDEVAEMHNGPIAVSVLSNQFVQRVRIHQALSPLFAQRLLPLLADYQLVVTNFVVKQAACEVNKFQLHQDPSFIDEAEQVGVTLWCPLQDVDQQNGNLGIVPRSHLLNQNYRTPGPLLWPDLEHLIEERYMRYLPMRAGQVLLMDQRMIHGSPANISPQARIVAAGVAVPQGQPLLYCHSERSNHHQVLEIHEVPDDFYLRNVFSERPKEGRHLTNIFYQVAALTPEILEQHCQLAA